MHNCLIAQSLKKLNLQNNVTVLTVEEQLETLKRIKQIFKKVSAILLLLEQLSISALK